MFVCDFTHTENEIRSVETFVVSRSGVSLDSSGSQYVINLISYCLVVYPILLLNRLLHILHTWKVDGGEIQSTHLEVSDKGLLVKSKLSFECNWEEFEEINESNTSFFFLTKNNILFVLPKRVFAEHNETEAAEKLIREHCAKKK